MTIKVLQPGGNVSCATEPVGGSQGSRVAVVARPCPASKGKKEKTRSLEG